MADQHLRMKQITGTTADWATCDIVLGNGEIGVEQTVDGVKIKIGDGASKFSALEYVSGDGGSVHVGTNAPTTKKDGDLWFDPVTLALKVYDGAAKAWTLIVNASTTSPWERMPNGIKYSQAGKFVSIGGSIPSSPAALNVQGDVKVTGTVTAGTFTGNQVTSNHSDIKIMQGARLTTTEFVESLIGRFTQSMTAGEVYVTNQGDSVAKTQVPALLGPTGQIIRGAHVVFGQIIRDADGVYRIRFTSADGSDHDINMMGQSITGLPSAATHPEAYNMYGPGGGVIADSAASVRWVENKFGGITGMNFRGAKDVIDGGDAPPAVTSLEANDWFIVRQDSYNDKGVLQGLMSDAWWDLLTPYSKLARTDEDGKQIREVFAGDHLIWAETLNPADSGFAYIENSNHHNRFISRWGDKMAGVLTFLKKTSAQNARPITYAGHGFSLGCFGAPFISDGITYPSGDTFSINAGGGAGASQIEFVVNDGAGTRYHQVSMAGNGSLRIPVSGSAYTAPGGIMLQQNNVHTGAHTAASGNIAYRVVAKHDASTAKKPFVIELPVRGGTAAEILIQPTGIIDNVSPGVSMSSVVVKSQLQPYLNLTDTGGTHNFAQGIDMKGFRIIGVNPIPTGDNQVVDLAYIKDNYPRFDKVNHRVIMSYKGTNSRLVNVADPVNNQDAMTLISFTRRLTTTGGKTAQAGKIPQLDGSGKISATMLPVAVSAGLIPKGGINIKASAPTNAKEGWTYWANASGTAHSSFGLGSVHVGAGDMVIYAGGTWHVIANEVDLAAFYTKGEADAKYALKAASYSKSSSDGRYLQLSHSGSSPKQTVKGEIIAAKMSTNYASIHSAHTFSGQDLKGTGNRMVYADPTGALHAGTAYPPAAGGTGGITQAQADARYVKTNGQANVHDLNTTGFIMSVGSILSQYLKGAGNRMLYADSVGRIHAGSAYPPATGGTSGISQAQADARYLQLSGGTVSGTLAVSGHANFNGLVSLGATMNAHDHKIINLGTPSNGKDAANKSYVDSKASDRRVKTSINDLSHGLDLIASLKPVSFNYSDPVYSKGKNQSRHYGFIAQDMQEAAPELVYNDPLDLDDDGNSESGLNILGFDQTELVPVLVNAVKELKEEIENLKRDLANARLS